MPKRSDVARLKKNSDRPQYKLHHRGRAVKAPILPFVFPRITTPEADTPDVLRWHAGDAVAHLRNQRRWSQTRLAREAQLKRADVDRLENGEINSWAIARVARCLGTTVQELHATALDANKKINPKEGSTFLRTMRELERVSPAHAVVLERLARQVISDSLDPAANDDTKGGA
jgi:ribosome-binding protein aMBF1 (putative translation factor)